MRKTLTWMTWLSLSAVTPMALAVGLGPANVSSYLNAPLDASIPLLESSDYALDDIRISVAEPSAFVDAGLEWTPQAGNVRVRVEELQGRRQVRLSSGQPMEEPWLELLFTLEYPGGQQAREVTLLFDPQGYSQLHSSQQGSSQQGYFQPYSQQAASYQSQAQAVAPRAVPVVPNTAAAQSTMTALAAINEPAPRHANSTYVGRGDTLWSVSERIKPGEASVQQMMFALLEANPEAFPSGNIHDMRAGQTLRIPDTERVLARSHRDADSAIKAMNEAWRSRRNGSLQAVTLPEVEPASVADAAVAAAQTLHAKAPTEAPAAAAGGSDVVTVDSSVLEADEPKADEAEPVEQALTRAELTAQLRLSQSTLQQVLEERKRMHAELSELRGEVASLTQFLSGELASQELSTQEPPTQEPPAQEPSAQEPSAQGASVQDQSSRLLAASMGDTDSPGVAGLVERYQWPLALGAIVLLVGLLVWLRKRREEAWDETPSASPVVQPMVSPKASPAPAPEPEAVAVTDPASPSGTEPELERDQPAPSAERGAPAVNNSVPAEDADQWLIDTQGHHSPQEDTRRYEKSQASGLAAQVRQRRLGLTIVPVARTERISLAPPPSSVGRLLASLGAGLPVSVPQARAVGPKTDKPAELTKQPDHRFIDYHPPILNSASSSEEGQRIETPMQPTVEFSSKPQAAPKSPAKQPRQPIEEEWEIEEVAFKPRGLDNSDPSKYSK